MLKEKFYALPGDIKKFLKSEAGVTSVEYAIVAAGVVAVVSVIFGSGGPVETMMKDVFTSLTGKISEILS